MSATAAGESRITVPVSLTIHVVTRDVDPHDEGLGSVSLCHSLCFSSRNEGSVAETDQTTTQLAWFLTADEAEAYRVRLSETHPSCTYRIHTVVVQ